MFVESVAIATDANVKCGYCKEPASDMDRDNGPRMYHCAQCELEGKGFFPYAQITMKPCGHVFRIGVGDQPFVMNP